jgi:glycosyltransferase involved in cell wall biosynthesis
VRVLIAHNRYRVPGGEERHVELLDQGLADAGADVRRFECESSELQRSAMRRFAAGAALAYRPGASGIGRVLDEWQPDVVHFHNLWPLLTPSALRAARRSGAGVVLTAHNFRFACPGGMLLRNGVPHDDCVEGSSLACALRDPRGSFVESLVYGLALEVQRRLGLLARWVDAFVAPSEFMGRMLVRAGLPERRVHVIPSGLPVCPRPARRRRFALYAGRLSEEKGVRTLLEASRRVPEVPLVVAGEGPLAGEVQAAANGTISCVGRLGREALAETLRNAAFTVVPSEVYENFPFSALESLAAGKPVIAARSGGLPEIVRDGVTGVLVPPGEPAALAEAMRSLWQEPQRAAQLGARGWRTARERFSLDRQTARMIDLYTRLAEAR